MIETVPNGTVLEAEPWTIIPSKRCAPSSSSGIWRKGNRTGSLPGCPSRPGYEKGEILFSRACFRKALGILLEGEATVRRFGDDRVILNRLSRGSAFGAAALYGDGEEYLTEIRAASPARVLFLTQERFPA